MAKWLDKYNDGGPIQENYNDASASMGPGFVGMGNNTKGRNYSPAWGGQFQWGGMLQPNDIRLPSAIAPPNREDILSSELARSIGGEDGEPAYLVPSFKGGRRVDEKKEFNKTGEHLGGPFKTWQEAEKFGEMRHEYVEKGQSLPSPLKWWGEMAMGGSIPGSVGFTYARTQDPAPDNGKYAKKTKASAQNGKEMSFYQNGLDFKPKSISKNGSVIKDDMGQWAHPGEITQINSNDITMKGVDYPVLGVSNTGDTQMMYPDQDYKFDGEKVTEFPMAQDGWLSKYTPEPMRQDATRNVIPRKMTAAEKKESTSKATTARQKSADKAKEVVAERTKNRQTKGDLNTPGSWHIEDKGRLFPSSVGGAGEMFDEYMNPATYVGVLADALGESVAAKDPKAIAMSLALAAGTGAIGVDPLGSTIKGVKSTKAVGKYLTEETALKNAHKLNPYAFKPDPEAYYRTLGKEGIDDAFNSGVIRPKQYHSQYSPEAGKRINVNTPEFPEGSYFNKSGIYSSDKLYNPNYIAEVKGKDELFTYPERIVFNENIRVAPKDIPIEQANFYKKDWLKGYKEVPKPTSTSRKLTNEEIRGYNQKLYLDRRKGLGNQGPTDAPPEGLMPFESPEYKQGGWLNKYK